MTLNLLRIYQKFEFLSRFYYLIILILHINNYITITKVDATPIVCDQNTGIVPKQLTMELKMTNSHH